MISKDEVNPVRSKKLKTSANASAHLTSNGVKHIAKLARLELTEKEIEKMQKDMSAILDYFNLLKKAPKLREAEREARSRSDIGPVRKDEAKSRDANMPERLVALTPDKKDDYIKVKAIF